MSSFSFYKWVRETFRRPNGPATRRSWLRLETVEDRVVPTTYTVTTTADSGAGSLRQALSDLPTVTVIDFDIPTSDANYNAGTGVWSILPGSALPAVSSAVLINGTSQPGYAAAGHPAIDIDGANAGNNVNGFKIASTGSTVQALAIGNFNGNGIEITGKNNTIADDFIGTDAAGVSSNANGNNGVLVESGATGNTIGGTTIAAGNLIAGNASAGVQFDGSGTSGNVLEYNLIGVDAANTAAIANGIDIVTSGGSSNNHILDNTQLSSGSWTEYSSTTNNGLGTMLLLPNGDIMEQESYDPSTGQAVTNAWDEITPDALGSYLDGSFSTLAPMSLQRLYYGSVVMPDGDVMVYGGEYSGASGDNNEVNSGEMYDPATNTWTSIASIPSSLDPQNDFGDESLEMLPDGNVLGGNENAAYAYIYDPSTNTWSKGPSKTNGDTYGEEAWVKLPGASADILDYEIWASMGTSPGYADYMNTSSTTWVATGSVPVALSEDSEGELGPALLMPNGLVLQVGANGVTDPPSNTALYNPSTNTWTAGPTIPDNLSSDDAPGATLPDGNAIFTADASTSATHYAGPTSFFEYNPNTKSLSQMKLPSALVSSLGNDPSYYGRMLDLPTGQIAFEDGDGNIWFYQESESVNPTWAPTISSMANDGSGVYTLSGTQLNGMDEGAEYGDDGQMASNYPIVQLTGSAGNVYDATSSNWSSVGVATGNTPVTTQFTLPAGLPVGPYMLDVNAVGISSVPVSVYYNGTTLSWTPVVSAVSPDDGPVSGGTTVMIAGSNLTGATFVDFGTTLATHLTVISDTEIIATVPAHAAGTVDVTVSNGISTSGTSSADQYTYVPLPVVSAVSPTSGSMFGGTTVTITGTGLINATAVEFGAVAATSYTVFSGTEIIAVAPAESAGIVDITVATASGTSAKSSDDQFTNIPIPLVTAISPIGGPLAGGTTVTITGQNFTGTTAVQFGTVAATSYTIVDGSEMMAVAPAESAGIVDITVTTADGTSATSSADQFSYVTAPIVASVGPDAGPLVGGQTVTITGTNLNTAVAVDFGTLAAGIVDDSATALVVTTPAEAVGTVDVTVVTAGGISPTSIDDEYTYVPSPNVTGLSATAGPLTGGSTITITGVDLSNATAVDFGIVAAITFNVVGNSEVTAVVPAESAGTVDVTVTTAGGISAMSSADQYTFVPVPAVASVAPGAGPAYGGEAITITGTNLAGATAIDIGALAATLVSDNSTQLIVTTPTEAAGTVDITVVTAGGTSATSAADHYTFTPDPTVTGLSTAGGPLAGGSSLTITGTNLASATAVDFGTIQATVGSDSATQVVVTVPAGTAGTVDVTVTTQFGGASLTSSADKFTYVAVPAVTAIDPIAGPTAGGVAVTITGTALAGATGVQFSNGTSTAAGAIVSDSATQLVVTSPAGAAGQVNITATTLGGTSLTSAGDLYTYVPAPTVQYISITQGSAAGDQTVTLTGSNLNFATAVDFGTVAATIVSDNSLQIVVTTPTEAAGTVTVIATTAGGTTTAPSTFTFVAVPAVTAVSPAAGSITGGTTVTITGSGFTNASAIDFGTTAATHFTVLSDTEATAVAPAHTSATVDVTVTTPVGGTSPTSAADDYAFTLIPVVTGLSPSTGPLAGGTMVTITGIGLGAATAVDFGTVSATIVSESATQLVATSPGGTVGTVDVTVISAGGTSATSSADRFTTPKAAPSFAGLSSPTITYGTTSATISGTLDPNAGSFTIPAGESVQVSLNGVVQTATLSAGDVFSTTFTTTALGAGNSPYTISFSYAGDANYSSASSSNATLTVNPAMPTFGGLSPPSITYGTATTTVSGTLAPSGGPFIPAGEDVQVTLDGVTQTAVLGGAGSFSTAFATSAIGVTGSPYTIHFAYATDGNFSAATGGSTLTVGQATPVFTAVSAPIIAPDTLTTTISGVLATAGGQDVPAGEVVQVTLDGTIESATVAAGGSFAATFDTAALDGAGSPYPVSLGYAGDANFATATSGTSVTVVPVDPAASVVSASALSVASGTSITVTVRAVDAAGNAFTSGGLTVGFWLDGGTGTGTFGSVTDNGNGTYSATFTGKLAGAATIAATIDNVAVGTTAAVTVTPGVADAANSLTTLSAATDPSSTSVTVTVTVRDAAGNDLTSGVLPTLSLGSTIGGQGFFSTVNGNGIYTATFTGTFAGDNTVVASIGGQTVPAADITVTAGQVSLSYSTLALPVSAVQLGGSTTVTLTAADAYGNPETTGGLDVVFALDGPGSVSPVVDLGDGTYTATITGTTDGNPTVTATIGGQPLVGAGPSLSVEGSAVSLAKSKVAVQGITKATVTAGGMATVTFQAENSKGQPEQAGGLNVEFELVSARGGKGTFTPAQDNGDGTYTATFEGTGAGSNTVTAVVEGVKGTAKAQTVKVAAGTWTAATSKVMLSEATVKAGGKVTVTLQPEDAFGNKTTAKGLPVTFALIGGGGSGQDPFGPVKYNAAAGTYTATFAETLAGPYTIAATMNGETVTSTAPITVLPGSASAAMSVLTSPPSVELGGTITITLQAVDAYGNILTTGGLLVAFSLAASTGTDTGKGTFGKKVAYAGNGQYTVTFIGTVAGSATILASIAGAKLKTGAEVTVE